ncbi:hypothetical protein V8J82_18010 [Gymnodinialimonas sp. 2305UL16-5]|uniref:hypothetical protein n=1 Tax=Gymnodinialimonas mytili TaxID=3126503 RepID=UPI0030B4F554
MGLLQVNWRADRLHIAAQSGIAAALAEVPEGRAVTILIHGYRFCPSDPRHNPHHHILSLTPRAGCWKAVSWPRHLHMGRADGPFGIAFGWPARGPLRLVADRAFDAGRGLGQLIEVIRAVRPDLRLNLMAHSLGARVALAAISASPAHSVDRAILIAGAEYRDIACQALQGQSTRVLNIRSAENLPFDIAFRASVPAPHLGALPLAAGQKNSQTWIDLRIDCARTRADLAALGHRIKPPATRFCHWSGYMRPGLFALYRRVLDPQEGAVLTQLQRISTQPRHRHTSGGDGAQLSPL